MVTFVLYMTTNIITYIIDGTDNLVYIRSQSMHIYIWIMEVYIVCGNHILEFTFQKRFWDGWFNKWQSGERIYNSKDAFAVDL
jgi:hypothetical protein